MAGDVLGQRVHDDVGAMFNWPAQVGRGHGVVDDQRDTVGVGDFGQLLEIGDVAERVADRFAVDGLGLAVNQRGKGFRLAVVGEAHRDAVLRQGVREQVVGAAVERRRRNDVVAGFGDGHDRVGDCRLARGQRQAGDAAFKRGDALFQHILRRVHDACVDVALDLQVEQVGTVLRVVEGVGSGLVDRHGHRLGGRVRAVAGVDGKRFELHAGASSGGVD